MIDFEIKENNGLRLVETAAAALNMHFFIDSGEGRDIETADIYLMDLSGWLIPPGKKEDFLTSDKNDDKWDDFFVFAEWRKNSEEIKIDFKKYPIYA
ncbi:MAG: hypothetical protein LBE35_11245 [Clostridiales bacterium]|jgi:hypothetical protein|nr:hypothetical protein [Clostridiales bacterium]